jgi:four helix bundle protein
MATFKRFEDIGAWVKARELAKKIYELCQDGPIKRDFELVSQMRKSSGSVMDNIAEGFGRGGNNEFIQFLAISNGSLSELKSQLYRTKDVKYINEATFNDLYQKSDEITKMINGLMEYLKKTDIRGTKFKNRTN